MLEAQQRGDRGQPGLRVLQPQHRRRRHVDPPAHRASCSRPRAASDGRSAEQRAGREPWQRPTARSGSAPPSSRRRRSPTSIRRIEIETAIPAKADPGVAHRRDAWSSAGQREKRSYSIVESSPTARYLAISVFRAPASRGGSVFMHTLRPGDTIEITQPLQNFPLRRRRGEYVLLAGGIGITAIVNMAAVLLSLKADYRLVYAGRSRAAMAYLDELVDAARGPDRGARRRRGQLAAGGRAHRGRPTAGHRAVHVRADPADGCGPPCLGEREPAGGPNLRYETFGNSGWFDPEEFTVTIPRLGVEATVTPGRSMLEALEAAGVDMMFDCRKGECGLCEVRVLDLDGVDRPPRRVLQRTAAARSPKDVLLRLPHRHRAK